MYCTYSYHHITGLLYNLSNLGYRVIQNVLTSCPALLHRRHLVQDVGALNEMAEVLSAFNEEYKTGGDIGWYGFLRKGRMSYTELNRRVPIMLGFVGRLTEKAGSKTDQGWKGFGKIDDAVFQDLYCVYQKCKAERDAINKPLGEEGAEMALFETALIY